jgi:tetratricopeptide (TPR) repeat protein
MVYQDGDAQTLVQTLDGLPLALATAGAYLYQVSTSFADYLRLYNASWLRLQQKTPQLLSYEDRALYSTWDISLDHVKQQSLPAAKLLQLWAYFDNQDVWFELLRECPQDGPKWLLQLTEDQLSFDEALRVLCEHALVEADATLRDDRVESLGYSMHSCVHSWTKHVVNEQWDVNIARLALKCVGLHVPVRDTRKNWVVEQRLVQHANRCHEYLGRGLVGQDDDEMMLRAIHKLGQLYAHRGKLVEAEEMFRLALEGKEKALGLGRDHTSTLETVNNLGILYKDQGKLDEAEEMYQRALAGYEKVLGLGRDHKSTLAIVNNLGLLYVIQGKLDEAEKMYQWALAGYEKVLRPDHISTLNTVNNLGMLYVDQGKLDEAEDMYLRALVGREKALGRDHTSTLNTANNLGILYRKQRKLDKAEEMYRRALAGKEKALGPDHIDTLNTVNNLSNLYVDQGKLDDAEDMYRRALYGYEKRLGFEHERCRRVRKVLATIKKDS